MQRVPGPAAAVVLGQLHVSCFITAANRATPVFEVLPERRVVRVVTKSSGVHEHAPSTAVAATPTSTAASTSISTAAANAPLPYPSAEWEFHAVFTPGAGAASHARDFFRELTQPALCSALDDGVNTNVIATGVHPTQKFRLLFGKTAPASPPASTAAPSTVSVDAEATERDVLDAHGQLGALLWELFTRRNGQSPHAASSLAQRASPQHFHPDSAAADGGWRVGISSWIIVNNAAIDLLKPRDGAESSGSSVAPASLCSLSFASLEAKSFASALRILHMAKTQRVVTKHTSEHSHFFVRLAFFRDGQLSTLHMVDVVDLKDFRDDAAASQEKQELYETMQEIRQLTTATPMSPVGLRSPPTSPRNVSAAAALKPKKMLLSNFLQPLLTQNAKTFLYTNVIDSRSSLRESVALLNAVANVRGFACVCRRLTGIDFVQLGFQAPPPDAAEDAQRSEIDSRVLDSAAAKAMAAVAIGESLLHRLAGTSSSSSLLLRSAALDPEQTPTALSQLDTALASPPVTSDAMSWLEAFKQRKRDIMTTTSSSGGVAISTGAAAQPPTRLMRVPSTSTSMVELPLGDVPSPPRIMAPASVMPLLPPEVSATPASGVATAARSSSGSSTDLYARLMETIQTASGAAASSSPRSSVRRSSSLPLPIEDPIDPPSSDDTFPLSKPALAPAQIQVSATGTAHDALERANLPTQVMTPPNLDGLDAETAARIQQTDAALLRKNYDALLSVVREQQQLREAAEARANEVVHDHEELRAQYELQIDNLRLEGVALKSKVRALERQSGCALVFDQYEHEIQGLQRQIEQLRTHNVQLELRLAGTSDHGSGGSGIAVSGAQFSEALGLHHGSAGGLHELKKRYQALAEDRQTLERQLAESRKKERQFHAQSKLISESSRKVDRLSRELTEKEDALVSTRLGKKRLDAEVHHAQRETLQLQQENERLLLEKAATTEELLAAKMYLASIESEQKKAAILDRFVRKHGDRMSRVRGSSSDPRGNNAIDTEHWRRDAQAREAEDKLAHAIKRAVPQLVPLVNRVLHKLELQELSLREFAEREVDFVNVLVDLVSDQPALALKNMIEDEMKKLNIL